MAELKPRKFELMRPDRVTLMASAEFGRPFDSKDDAVAALSRLPVHRQHALKKSKSGKAAKSRPVSKFSNELRGGVAVPSAEKLANASADVVRRYARATIGLETKSKAQALTLMAKFAPTDVKKVAGSALGRSDLRAAPKGPSMKQLVAAYTAEHGVRPRSSMTKEALSSVVKVASSPDAPRVRKVPLEPSRMMAPPSPRADVVSLAKAVPKASSPAAPLISAHPIGRKIAFAAAVAVQAYQIFGAARSAAAATVTYTRTYTSGPKAGTTETVTRKK